MEWSSPADQALVLGRSRGSGKGWRHHCGMGAAMPSSQLVTEYWPWLCSCLWKQDPAFTATLITSHLKAAQAGLTKAPTLGGRPAASRSAWNNPGYILPPPCSFKSPFVLAAPACSSLAKGMLLKRGSNHLTSLAANPCSTPSHWIAHGTELKQCEDRIWGFRVWPVGITLSLCTQAYLTPQSMSPWKLHPCNCSSVHLCIQLTFTGKGMSWEWKD